MKEYSVIRAGSGEPDWSTVPSVEIGCCQTSQKLPVKAYAQMCWSKTAVHVRLAGSGSKILARFNGDCDPVYRDSCLECFLCPDASDGRYFNFEINPNGASFVGFGYGRADRIRLHPWNIRELLSIKTEVSGDLWTVRFDIPLDFLQLFMPDLTLQPGHRMRGNFYTCGDDVVPNIELTWNPLASGNTDFHQPESFGSIILT